MLTLAELALLAIQASSIPGTPTCTSCRVEFRPVVAFGDKATGLEEWPVSAIALRSGDWLLTQPSTLRVVSRHDCLGRYRGSIGRVGDGPGEFQSAKLLVRDASDSVFVYESSGRLQVYSPRLDFVRRVQVPPLLYGLGMDPGGQLFGTGLVWMAGAAGFHLHEIGRDGSLRRSFGPSQEPVTPITRPFTVFLLAAGRDGGTVLAHKYDQRIWSLDRGGSVQKVFTTPRRWYADLPTSLQGVNSGEIRQRLGVWLGPDGLLWVLTLVPDPNRSSATMSTLRTPEGTVATAPVSQDEWWDTLIEVIDLERERSILQLRVPWRAALLTDEGLVMHVTERPDGFFRAELRQMVLRGENQPRRGKVRVDGLARAFAFQGFFQQGQNSDRNGGRRPSP